MTHIRAVLLLLGLLAASPALADWLALAVDDGGAWAISVRNGSKKEAESDALRECTKSNGVKCRVVGTSDQLGYVAVARSGTSLQAWIDDTLDGARRLAINACVKETNKDDVCTIRWTGINGVVREQAQTAQNDCRPRTREIRCQSNCVNGDCIVEYENGCRIRVRVSPRFDPFDNRWNYPSPSC